MKRPCSDRHYEPVPGKCHLCWLYVNREDYKQLWSDRVEDSRCKHLGVETGEFRSCTSCNQTLILLPIYHCTKHGKCLLEKPQADMADCKSCDDYERRDNGSNS